MQGATITAYVVAQAVGEVELFAVLVAVVDLFFERVVALLLYQPFQTPYKFLSVIAYIQN